MTVVAPDETPLAHQRQQRLRLWLLLAPGALWLFFFFVLPLLIVMLYSFATLADRQRDLAIQLR
jgi:ABC-type spermidine/putrescine transport system permease subunit I